MMPGNCSRHFENKLSHSLELQVQNTYAVCRVCSPYFGSIWSLRPSWALSEPCGSRRKSRGNGCVYNKVQLRYGMSKEYQIQWGQNTVFSKFSVPPEIPTRILIQPHCCFGTLERGCSPCEVCLSCDWSACRLIGLPGFWLQPSGITYSGDCRLNCRPATGFAQFCVQIAPFSMMRTTT